MSKSGMQACFSFLLVACASSAAQEYRLAERLPAGTLAYLSVPNALQLRQAIAELGVVKLFSEPGSRRLVTGVQSLVSRGLEQLDPSMRAVFDEVVSVANDVRGEVAIALIDVDEQRGMPVFAAAVDFGDRAASFAALLERRLASYAERGVTLGSYELGDRKVGTVEVSGLEVHHAFAGGAWIATNDGARMGALLGAAIPASLASEASFAGARARVLPASSKPILHVHVGLAAALERFGPMLPERVRTVIEGFDLDRLHAISYGMSVEGGAVAERFRVHAPDGLGSLRDLVDSQPTAHPALRSVPANAFWYGSSRVRFDGWARAIQRVAALAHPGGEPAVKEFLDGFARRSGFRLESDFASNLGPEVSYYAAFPEGGGLLPEFALGLEVQDAVMFKSHVEKLLALASAELGARFSLASHEHAGLEYATLEIEAEQESFVLHAVRPCLFQRGKFAVVTLFPHTMKAVLERIAADGAKPSLADDPDFAALYRRAPQGHSSFGYFRAKGLIAYTYNTLVPLAQGIGQHMLREKLGAELDLIDLPSASALSRHLVDLASWSQADEQGFEGTVISPIGVIPTIGVLVLPALMFTARASEVRATSVEIREAAPATQEEWEIDENGNLRRKR